MPTVPWGATQEHILISEAKTLQAHNPRDSVAIAIRSALACINAQEEQLLQLRAQLNIPVSTQPPAARIQ